MLMLEGLGASDLDLDSLIVQNIPLDALRALADAYRAGNEKCLKTAKLFDKGHRSSGAGQNRHFFINEAFHDALAAHGANPTRLCGAKIVTGRFGVLNVARLNIAEHPWSRVKKSKTRKQLASINEVLERQLVQGDMFIEGEEVLKEGTVFIVGLMNGYDADAGISTLTGIRVAIPSADLDGWLYFKSLDEVLKLYTTEEVPDLADLDRKAQPVLKKGLAKKTGT